MTGESEPARSAGPGTGGILRRAVRFRCARRTGRPRSRTQALGAAAGGSIDNGGGTRVRKQATLPVKLPLGYHEVTATVAGETATCRVAITPERAWTPAHLGRGGRAAGIAVSLYGVRSERNWGCGDFRDLLRVIDWVAEELGASFVALNPLHAIHNRRPFNTSPYLPNCIFYQNFLYLDVEAMEDYARSPPCAAVAAIAPEAGAEIEELRATPFVEYERVARAQAALPQAAVRAVPARVAQRDRRGRASSSFRRSARASCSRVSPPIARSTSTCTAAIRTSGCGPTGRSRISDPDSAETRAFREKHWRRGDVLPVPAVADRHAVAARAAAGARPAAVHRPVSRSGAGHRPFRLRPVGAPAVLRGGLPRRVAARRFLAQGPGLGASRRPTRSGTARTATACSPNPSARIAGTAARCASTT